MLRMKTLSMIFDCLPDAPTSTLLLGKSVDIMLSEHPDLPTAKAFFRSTMVVTGVTPDRVTTDGHDPHPRAVRTGAALQCVDMFPLWRGGRGICGKPRLFSLSWQQLEGRRRWSKFVEPDGAKSYRTVAGMPR
jgi:hypothetical protein